MDATSDRSHRLEIRLLGPFRALASDVEVDADRWTRRKPLALVKLLAAHPSHRMHREQIVDLLWPELDPESASNQLYKALHFARRALEPALAPRAESAYLVAREHSIALTAPDGLDVDADRFERLAAEALRGNEVASCVAALDVYGDDMLLEDPYDEWLAPRRESLRATRHRLLHHAAALARDAHAYEQAIELYATLVARDAADEEAHRGLMTVYARTDRRHLARAQYTECAEAVRRELDAEPEPETLALLEAIEAAPFAAPLVEVDGPVRATASAIDVEAPRPPRPAALRMPAIAWRKLSATVASATLAAALAVPFVGPGWVRHKLGLFYSKAVAAVHGERPWQPPLLSLKGRVSLPGARLEALDSISGWATIADRGGNFTLLDVQFRPGASYDIVCSTGSGASRVVRVTAPATYPTSGVLDLGDVAMEKGRVVDAATLYGVNSLSYLEYDAANAEYYRGVFDALTASGTSDEERIAALDRYVGSRYVPTISPIAPDGPRGVLESGSSNCGDLALAMATLCHAGGYGVRMVDMAEADGIHRSYMIVEVFYASEWHAYDPAYGIVLHDANGRVPSYSSLRSDPSPLVAADYPSIPRPGWASSLIPELYVSGIHHLYTFRHVSGDVPAHHEREVIVPVAL